MRRLLIPVCAVLAVACASNRVAPPLVAAGNQPVQLPRERAYLACVTALYHQFQKPGELRLGQSYRAADRAEANLREFHLKGTLRAHGRRQPAYFVCTTERFGRPVRVLSINTLTADPT